MKRVNIIGIGNYNIMEDTIGLEAIEGLDKLLADRGYLLNNKNGESISVKLYTANQDPILAGAIITEGDPVLIVDAVDMKLPPRSVRTFTLKEAILNFTGKTTSTHGFDLAEILKLVQRLGYASKVRIIGIQIDRNRLNYLENNPANEHKQQYKNEIKGEMINKIILKILEEVKQIA